MQIFVARASWATVCRDILTLRVYGHLVRVILDVRVDLMVYWMAVCVETASATFAARSSEVSHHCAGGWEGWRPWESRCFRRDGCILERFVGRSLLQSYRCYRCVAAVYSRSAVYLVL